ncbi:unnamed protein product, partial [Staurois parvus]
WYVCANSSLFATSLIHPCEGYYYTGILTVENFLLILRSQIMEANPVIKNAANCATKSIHQKVSDTQRGSSISPDHTAAPPVMLCTLSSAESVAKDLMLAKQDR